MSDIQAGDIVVCIDAAPCRCGCGDPVPVRRDGLYKVLHALWDGQQSVIALAGINHKSPSHPMGFGINVNRFRKIDKADESFTETVRACRPIEHETASERLAAWMEQGARHEG